MADSDDIRSDLNDLAASIDAGDIDSARRDVHAHAQRRRTRTRIAGGLATLALVVTAGVAVVNLGGSGAPDTLVSADPADSATSTDLDVPETTLAIASTAGARTVEVVGGSRMVGSVPGADGSPEFAEWIVPWRDGFLVGSTSYPAQPLPDELPEEVVALFPQEVVDLFEGQLPATISDATEVLSAAGLLDEVTQIIEANPAASEAIYGAPVEAPSSVDVQFTTDGSTWDPVEMTLPPGASQFYGFTAVGDRLALAYTEVDPQTGSSLDGVVKVATTTDLVDWTVQEFVLPVLPVVLPDGVSRNVGVQSLAANDTGWVVSVYDSVDLDVYRMVSDDLRARLDDENGYGVSQDDDGVTVEVGLDDDGSATESIRYTWADLGIPADVVPYLSGARYQPTMWAAAWDGIPQPSDTVDGSGQVLATPAGFLQWTDRTLFSTDGLTWAEHPLPDPEGYVEAAFAFDGGAIALSRAADGTVEFYRVDDVGRSAQLLDVPGLPPDIQGVGFGYGSGAAPGAFLDASIAQNALEPLVVDVDGYRLTIQDARFEVSDIATGEIIAMESFNRRAPSDDGPIQLGADGVTVVDTTTGDVVVVFPEAALNAAEREMNDGAEPQEYTPDFWLIASADGERFVVEDIDDGMNGPNALAGNMDRLLVQTADSWTVYDLS